MPMNDFQPWPDGWPQHFNATNYPCDMLVGPCACKAWHRWGEFELVNGVLHRNGEPVAASSVLMPEETIEVSRAEWDRLNAALARESRRVHELLRENADLRAELERARNAE
jgi:hypothetical protein